jgi:predicted nucleotidyltransferase
MTKQDALRPIGNLAPQARALGVTGLYLFGSTARDQATQASDLDIFVDYDHGRPFSLLDLMRVQHLFEDANGGHVDVATRAGLHPALRSRIEREAIRVF